MRTERTTCAQCNKDPKAMNQEGWECSAVECPTRPVCWAGFEATRTRLKADLPNPFKALFDRTEA